MTRPADLARIEDDLARGLAGAAAFGAAAALVLGDRSWVFAHGLARPGQAVTAATPFHICSCAKTFTAAVFSRLVQDGSTTWDTPVHGLVPEFEFGDPAVTRDCTFRDLATMRTGLGRDGIAEWGIRQDLPKAVRLARARYMGSVSPFRSTFSYSNLGYIALSLAAERLTGKPYPQLVRELLCAPLGLADSYSAGFTSAPDDHAASPCLPIAGEPVSVRDLTGPNSEGSARMQLSGRDAARWVRFLLAALGGSDAGPLSSASVQAMATPQTAVKDPDVRMAPQAGAGCAYGMGLFATQWHAQPLLRHGGGGRGWRHAMALAPEAQAGVMLMASAESPLVDGLALQLLEALTGREPADWGTAFARAATDAARTEQDRLASLFPVDAAVPPQPLRMGAYANAVTGQVQLQAGADGIRLVPADAPDFNATLQPLGGAVYRLDFDEPALSPQALDPPFRLRATGTAAAPVLETSYFGRLRSVA